MKTFTEEGCFAYDTINIKVFTTAPDIFVPNAFTPNNSSNNIFRPIPVGISKIEYFRVYNRNGMLDLQHQPDRKLAGMETITVNHRRWGVMSGWSRAPTIPGSWLQKKEPLFLSAKLISSKKIFL